MDADLQAIDLAAISDFDLGPLRVSPSNCRVYDGDTEERVEARVMAVLVTLARGAPRTVTRDELVAACWGGRIVTDDAISRAIAKLRALARSHAPPAFAVETVTKVGFRLVPADASTVLERAQTPPRRTSWRPLALMAAGLTGAVIMMAVALSAPQRQTYVVLSPLERRTPELERLSGLTHDAVLRMATASGLAMFEPGTNRAHDAEFLFSGALDQDGEAPTVTLRLTHAETNLALWSRTFVGDENGEPALADMAATRGIDVLRCTIAERERERSQSIAPEILALYMNVCDASVIGDFDGMIGAARMLTEGAPNSATAHALLANALASAATMTRTPAEVAALRREAAEEAQRALRLNRRQPRAYLALANAQDAPDGWVERERLLQRALAIDPNLNSAHNFQVNFLREVGRWREALEMSERRNTGERTSALPQLALLQGSQGDVAGAYETLERLARIYPSDVPQLRWTILVWWDTIPRARRLNGVWGEELPDASVACFDAIFARLAAHDGGASLPSSCRSFDENWQARMLARLGDVDAALDLLSAPEQREARSTITLFYPEMSAVRADPRFTELVRSNGLLEYWRTTGNVPDFCASESAPQVCAQITSN